MKAESAPQRAVVLQPHLHVQFTGRQGLSFVEIDIHKTARNHIFAPQRSYRLGRFLSRRFDSSRCRHAGDTTPESIHNSTALDCCASCRAQRCVRSFVPDKYQFLQANVPLGGVMALSTWFPRGIADKPTAGTNTSSRSIFKLRMHVLAMISFLLCLRNASQNPFECALSGSQGMCMSAELFQSCHSRIR